MSLCRAWINKLLVERTDGGSLILCLPSSTGQSFVTVVLRRIRCSILPLSTRNYVRAWMHLESEK